MTTTQKTVEINGSSYTVARASENMVFLKGKRGGESVLVRNVNSGRWVFLRSGVREEKIVSISGVA